MQRCAWVGGSNAKNMPGHRPQTRCVGLADVGKNATSWQIVTTDQVMLPPVGCRKTFTSSVIRFSVEVV